VNRPGARFVPWVGSPLIIERGKGAYLYDADGNELARFCLLMGSDAAWWHRTPGVDEKAIAEQNAELGRKGNEFMGATTGNLRLPNSQR